MLTTYLIFRTNFKEFINSNDIRKVIAVVLMSITSLIDLALVCKLIGII